MNNVIDKLNELKLNFVVDYSKELEVLEKEINEKIEGKLYKSSKEIEKDVKKYNSLKDGKLVNYNYKKGVNAGVGVMVRDLIKLGKDNAEILKLVCKHYGNDNTTASCISWYRNDIKKAAKLAVKV